MASDEEKRAWVARVLGMDLGGAHAGSGPSSAMASWQSARQDAIADLRSVIGAVQDTGDPDAEKVEIVLSSIIKNLSETPDTPQAVQELIRYIEADDVIDAAEEVPAEYGSLDLRGPLLAALAGMAA